MSLSILAPNIEEDFSFLPKRRSYYSFAMAETIRNAFYHCKKNTAPNKLHPSSKMLFGVSSCKQTFNLTSTNGFPLRTDKKLLYQKSLSKQYSKNYHKKKSKFILKGRNVSNKSMLNLTNKKVTEGLFTVKTYKFKKAKKKEIGRAHV